MCGAYKPRWRRFWGSAARPSAGTSRRSGTRTRALAVVAAAVAGGAAPARGGDMCGTDTASDGSRILVCLYEQSFSILRTSVRLGIRRQHHPPLQADPRGSPASARRTAQGQHAQGCGGVGRHWLLDVSGLAGCWSERAGGGPFGTPGRHKKGRSGGRRCGRGHHRQSSRRRGLASCGVVAGAPLSRGLGPAAR
jgi:hypothetical protein